MKDLAESKEETLIKSKARVQKHGEVFTPQWVVDKMLAIPGIDEKTNDVFATFLEPSAGEGAFLLAIEDAKLKFVSKRYKGEAWNMMALFALSSIYGIEYLEDNLEVAREAMLKIFLDYAKKAQGKQPTKNSDVYKSAKTIIWANVVQGDTLSHKNNAGEEICFSHWQPEEGEEGQVRRRVFSYSSLFGKENIAGQGVQLSLFNALDAANSAIESYALIDIELVWKEEKDLTDKEPAKFKFDVVIGNPPYQEESIGEGTQTPPIYHKFLDEAYKIANRASFITPARFLYNAGATPKDWNRKMLSDEHLKVEFFEQDSSKVFPMTDIKGGVAVTYRDASAKFGAIGTFTAFKELNGILKKVLAAKSDSFSTIISGQMLYKYTDKFHEEHPEAENLLSSGHKYDVSANAFDTLGGGYFRENLQMMEMNIYKYWGFKILSAFIDG